MKYAVIYLSETGNTAELARIIFESLPGEDKKLIDVHKMSELPKAEKYFIGFPVKNRSCGIEILDVLEQIEGAGIALFVSCGLPMNEKYKKYIENAVRPWINDDCEYLDMFLCQGKVSEAFREKLESETNYSPEELDKIADLAAAHPNDYDIDALCEFVELMA